MFFLSMSCVGSAHAAALGLKAMDRLGGKLLEGTMLLQNQKDFRINLSGWQIQPGRQQIWYFTSNSSALDCIHRFIHRFIQAPLYKPMPANIKEQLSKRKMLSTACLYNMTRCFCHDRDGQTEFRRCGQGYPLQV